MEVICTLVTKKVLEKLQCLIWFDFGIGWAVNILSLTVTSNFSSIEVWVSLINSWLWIGAENCRLLFILFTGRMWYLRFWRDDEILGFQVSVDTGRDQE